MNQLASIIGAFALLGLSACASVPPAAQAEPAPTFHSAALAAHPVLGEDIAMNREAQAGSAYAALTARASPKAVTFTPQPTGALRWLVAQGEQAMPIAWQPHSAFMSCDGRTGVTTGAISWGDQAGYYTTVWQYFGRDGAGEWRWVMSHGDRLDAPRPAPQARNLQTASCEGQPTVALSAPAQGVKMRRGLSRDQSLSYQYAVRPDGSRVVSVGLWDGARHQNVLRDVVEAR